MIRKLQTTSGSFITVDDPGELCNESDFKDMESTIQADRRKIYAVSEFKKNFNKSMGSTEKALSFSAQLRALDLVKE